MRAGLPAVSLVPSLMQPCKRFAARIFLFAKAGCCVMRLKRQWGLPSPRGETA
jgi:hypothetical protein